MSIDLHLTREEVPVFKNGAFYLPVHKKLLDPFEFIAPVPATALFRETFNQFDRDIKLEIVSGFLLGSQESELKDYLDSKPRIQGICGGLVIRPQGWQSGVRRDFRNLVTSFYLSGSPSRIHLGISYNSMDKNCRVNTKREAKNNKVNMDFDKASEFGVIDENQRSVKLDVYAPVGITNYTEGLFLRNWALTYMNIVLENLSETE